MLRTVLCLYLTFVAILGPGLCCCGLELLIAKKNAACISQKPEKKKCCQHAGQKQSSGKPSDHNHSPVPFCPCNDHKDVPVTISIKPLELGELDNGSKLSSFFQFDHSFSGACESPPWTLCTFLSFQSADMKGINPPFVLRS